MSPAGLPIKQVLGEYSVKACEHNGCVEALSSIRRYAEVAPKCPLRSLVMRKKMNSMERAIEAKERGRGKKGEKGELSWWVASLLDHHGTMPAVR